MQIHKITNEIEWFLSGDILIFFLNQNRVTTTFSPSMKTFVETKLMAGAKEPLLSFGHAHF